MGFKNPYVHAILFQFISASMVLLSKAVYDRGMNVYVFVFYRQFLSSLVMIPLAIIFEWRSLLSLDFRTFCKIFGISLIGVALSRNLYGFGLKFTSSTVGAAILNIVPVTTIAFAVILRMEKVDVRKRVGLAKIGGIMLCLGGVALVAFYKGPSFMPSLLKHPPLDLSTQTHRTVRVPNALKWLEGCLLLFISICAWSLGLVLQGKVLENYPSKLTFATVLCASSAVQTFIVAIAEERDMSQWRLGFNFRLLVVVYSGIVATGVSNYLQVWILKVKGPVFLAMFMPLSVVIAVICSLILLGEAINLASILSCLLLVGSLYSVLWAKRTEEEEKKDSNAQINTIVVEKQESYKEDTRV